MEAKKQLLIKNFRNHLFRFYHSLQDIKQDIKKPSGLENLKDPELTEQEFKLQY